jgi:hypothetical protein
MNGQPKVWYKSKTIIGMVLLNMVLAGWKQLSPDLGLSAGDVALINGLVAIILRSITKGPVTLKTNS